MRPYFSSWSTILLFTNQRKKTNRAVVSSCRPFPNILKCRNHCWHLPINWEICYTELWFIIWLHNDLPRQKLSSRDLETIKAIKNDVLQMTFFCRYLLGECINYNRSSNGYFGSHSSQCAIIIFPIIDQCRLPFLLR